jgi:D-alanyl-D-alanine carboxypeptidase (penicillin-binding protein 5/6)
MTIDWKFARMIFPVCALIFAAASFPGSAAVLDLKEPLVPIPADSAPNVKAASGILVDVETRTILWQRNADEPRPIASLTKVMTALLLLEHTKPDELISAPAEASLTQESSIHLVEGERLTAADMLYAIMLRSANDACVAIAHHISGSVPAFAALMNRRAEQLGCRNTHFVNPNGLHDPNHYSSASDMARITLAALEYPLFNQVIATRKHTLSRSRNQGDLLVVNKSRILGRFEGADGVKTGYTRAAGRCFIGSATRNGRRVLSVVLNSPDVWADTEALLEYGFRGFDRRILVPYGAEIGRVNIANHLVPCFAGKELVALVPRGWSVSPKLHPVVQNSALPIPKGFRIGVARVVLGGRAVASVPIMAAESVEKKRTNLKLLVFPAVIAFFVVRAYARKAAKANIRRRVGIKKEGGGINSRRARYR